MSKKKNQTSITSDSRKKMKPRGRSKRTIILEAIKEESLLGLSSEASSEEVEKSFFAHIANRAFDIEDQNSGMCLRLLADKGWSSVKPTMEHVEFDFDENASPAIQASQVMKAASEGRIAPDIANMFVSSIASMLKIEEVTEIRKELDSIKEMLGMNNE
jgi:hypothetical protein